MTALRFPCRLMCKSQYETGPFTTIIPVVTLLWSCLFTRILLGLTSLSLLLHSYIQLGMASHISLRIAWQRESVKLAIIRANIDHPISHSRRREDVIA